MRVLRSTTLRLLTLWILPFSLGLVFLPDHMANAAPPSGSWTATGSMATARAGHPAVLLRNGKVLVTGGPAELYDPLTGIWTPTGPMSNGDGTLTLLANGRVLAAGGGAAELYDPSTDLWTPTGPMTTARTGHGATLLPNGKVLVEGGFDSGTVTASAELYNPVTGTWAPTGAMGNARVGHSVTLLDDGKVLVAAGTMSPCQGY